MITVEKLSKSIKDKPILSDISFEIEAGECVALIGPNGAGKTTLMSCLLGDVAYQKGTIRLFGLSPKDKALRHQVAVLFQDNVVQKKMTVNELITFQQAIYKDCLTRDEIEKFLQFSQKQYADFAEKLSGGQKRLLQFVLALVGKPKLLFLDEPTAGMDTSTRQYFWEMIEELKSKGITIIYSSHYIEEVEHTADRILVLNQGRLLRDTTPYAMKAEEKQKVFTVPSRFKSEVEKWKEISDLEVNRDNLIFVTREPDFVWKRLENSGCSIRDIEMSNRSLLDSIFMTTEREEK
ncbi:ABC transporter ATP-binding protein [Streptococcus loxodontisalivarius]|uniref:ABC-2 type transport system ATP-binding protein n=1 Tax=Streptococcus loxodontisalivarius TaxID=1349415 RepID=A0ABS2PRU0_9STRE|nr:ABC transporter ATP-binding protein [Streptococcus loxodontisalivarius]MBM7642591.1 ABC-2 type transport system ATP-binding protein [Streptococcus loxodontisalivarius]